MYGEVRTPESDYHTAISGFVTVPSSGESDTIVRPVLFDEPLQPGETSFADPLSWQMANEYIIKRIVGKLHVGHNNIANAPNNALVTAGFFVARADDSTPVTPVGGPGALSQYAPNILNNIREPWMWRRTWMLTKSSSTNQPTYPTTNSSYGDIESGPHVDIAVGRRVGNDDRLWFALSAELLTPGPSGVGYSEEGAVSYVLDVRLLGLLVKAKGKSTF